jgi:hypothetical protein
MANIQRLRRLATRHVPEWSTAGIWSTDSVNQRSVALCCSQVLRNEQTQLAKKAFTSAREVVMRYGGRDCKNVWP